VPRGEQEQSREIVRLAVPALGALVSEPLFQLCDAAIVGHLGPAQLAGLGAAGAALATLVNVCIFLAYGTTSAVARRMGAGDRGGAAQQGIDGMWVALLLGLGIAAVAVPLAGPIVGAFGASPAARSTCGSPRPVSRPCCWCWRAPALRAGCRTPARR
jgi:Na+-driven multidrug efflux pump